MKSMGLCLAIVLAAAGVSRAQGVDNSIYADLLARHVSDGWVDYAGFKAEEQRLDDYLAVLEAVEVAALERDEALAFWINVYNAWTIKLILRDYPEVESIKDYGRLFRSPWKIRFVKADGRELTLDEVEHGIIRPEFGDPRIHFAVNCASKSCPVLRGEPYQGSVLDRQLDEQTVDFINDPAFNRMDEGTLYLSRIFRWYREDFEPPGLADYVRRYARGVLLARLEAAGSGMDVAFLEYDWSLNGE